MRVLGNSLTDVAVSIGLTEPRVVCHPSRVRQIKRADGSRKHEARIASLLRLAEEFGAEKLLHEIAVHERKIGDLREALHRFQAIDGRMMEGL